MSRFKPPTAETALAVLVVEDDPDTRRLYSDYLRLKGWLVFTANDGRSGLDKVLDLTPDVVVLDLAMPRVDGWTMITHLRESSWTEQILIVVVSALADVRDEAFQFGCDAFLAKPCPPDVLWQQIRALTRLSQDLKPGQSRRTASR